MQSLIIDWPIARGIRSSLDQDDRATGRHLECLGDSGVGRSRFQLVVSFDQRCVVRALQQCENGLGLKVVLRNLLPQLARLICLVERHCHTIG
jgi:hypothetical protein